MGLNMAEPTEILLDATNKVLEGAAFVFTAEVDPSLIPADPLQWDAEGVSLAFEGPRRGEVHLWVERALTATLASNLLGIDMSDPQTDLNRIDSLKEVLNMIVGNLVTGLFGTVPVVHLDIPHQLSMSEIDETVRNPQHIWLDAEGALLLASISLE